MRHRAGSCDVWSNTRSLVVGVTFFSYSRCRRMLEELTSSVGFSGFAMTRHEEDGVVQVMEKTSKSKIKCET